MLAMVSIAAALLATMAPGAQAAVGRAALGGRGDLAPAELSSGKAVTKLALARVDFTNLSDRGRVPATLGEIVATADTIGSLPLSVLKVTGVQADDKKAVEWQRDSSSPDAVGYKDGVPDMNRGGVKTEVGVGGWGATTDGPESAVARLGVLDGQLDSNNIGLKGSLGERGFVSQLGADQAVSRASVTLEGFNIDLGALLPVDLVGLPFGMSYQLTEELNLPMPEQVQQGVDSFTSVLAQMQLVEGALAAVDEAEARVAARAAQAPELTDVADEKALAEAALDAALADAEGAVAAVEDAEAALAAASAAIPSAEDAVTAAQAAVAGAQDAADAAAATTAAAAAEVARIQAELDALRAQAAQDPIQALLLAGDIAMKEAELDAAQADLGDAQSAQADTDAALAAAQAHATDAEAALAAATDEEATKRAARDAARAALGAVEAAADAARDRLATAQLAYDAALAAQAEADDEIAALAADAQAMKARLAVLFVELRGLLDALPDLLGLQESLLDALEATPVLRIGAVHLTSEASASAEGARTFTECRLSGVEVLGKPVPTLTCEDLAEVRESIETRIEEFLTLVAGQAVEGVLIDGPVATVTQSAVPDELGYHRATVHFTPLRVQIPTADIGMTWDAAHVRLGELTTMLLERADLRTLPEFSDVPSVPLQHVPVMALGLPAGGRVRVQSADRWRIAGGPAPLATELEELKEDIDQTPPGSPVQGDVPGIDAELGGLDNEATFRPAQAGGGGPVGGGGGGGGNGGNGGNGGTGGGAATGSGSGEGADSPAADGQAPEGAGDQARGGAGQPGQDGTTGRGGNTGPGGDGSSGGGPGDPVPATDLPHTGGGAPAVLAGLVLLLGGAGLRRRR